jgi:hypothetical protein
MWGVSEVLPAISKQHLRLAVIVAGIKVLPSRSVFFLRLASAGVVLSVWSWKVRCIGA